MILIAEPLAFRAGPPAARALREDAAKAPFRRDNAPSSLPPVVLMGRAKEMLRAGHPSRAVEFIECILTENPRDVRALSLLIKAQGLAGRTGRARDVYDYAVREGIDDSHIHSAMISAHCRRCEVLPASALIDDARKRGMDEGYAYCSLIHAYGKLGLPDDAEKFFRLAKEGGKADAAVYTAMIGVRRRDAAAANELLQEARRAGATDSDLYSAVITANMEAGRPADARGIYRMAVSDGNGGPALAMQMAQSYYSRGHFEECIRFIDSLPRRARGSSRFRLQKAEALRKLRRYDEAIDQANTVLKLARHASESQKDSARIIIGYCLDCSGRHEEAFSLFNRMRPNVSPLSGHYSRLLCGLVYSWEALGCGRLGNEELKGLRERLKSGLSRAEDHLRRDILNAMRIIDRHFAPDVST